MNDADELTSLVLASLPALPLHKHAYHVRAFINAAIKQLSVYRILEIRQRILADLNDRLPDVRATIEMLEGQLILREIAGDDRWR